VPWACRVLPSVSPRLWIEGSTWHLLSSGRTRRWLHICGKKDLPFWTQSKLGCLEAVVVMWRTGSLLCWSPDRRRSAFKNFAIRSRRLYGCPGPQGLSAELVLYVLASFICMMLRQVVYLSGVTARWVGISCRPPCHKWQSVAPTAQD